jgi:hypothetical protein
MLSSQLSVTKPNKTKNKKKDRGSREREGHEGRSYICEDAVRELVFLGVHALLDERVPHLDILGVPWSAFERGDGAVYTTTLAKLDEPSGKFIRLQKRTLSLAVMRGFSFIIIFFCGR